MKHTFNVDGGVRMETKELKYAEEAVKKGYAVEMECADGDVRRITAGRTPQKRRIVVACDFMPIQIC